MSDHGPSAGERVASLEEGRAFARDLLAFRKAVEAARKYALPLPFKVYPARQRIALPPLGLHRRLGAVLAQPSQPLAPADWLSLVLALSAGVTRYSALAMNQTSTPCYIRRPVASGGAFYPDELYVYVRSDSGVPPGLYHYDAADHALVVLAPGDHDQAVSEALGHRLTRPAVVFVSALLWKNYVKYDEFGHRLLGQDTGVLLGQLLAMGERLAGIGQVHFNFLDDRLSDLIGLDLEQESVYAVVTMGPPGQGLAPSGTRARGPDEVVPDALLPTYAGPHPERVLAMHRSALLRDPGGLATRPLPQLEPPAPSGHEVPLPPALQASMDLVSAARQRSSGGSRFVPSPVSPAQLGAMLAYAARAYASDVRPTTGELLSGPLIGVTCTNVPGVPPGAYVYRPQAHALLPVHAGDHRNRLSESLLLPVINMRVPAACMHVIGSRDFHGEILGNRGYRIQQMESGVMGQRLQLAATALGLAANMILGYDTPMIESLYKLEGTDLVPLLQIVIGATRLTFGLEGNLNV